MKGSIKDKIEDWLDGSLFGYRRGYILSRPLQFIKGVSREIEWAYQRVTRGWDDRVVWSLDWYLAKTIPEWIKVLKDNKMGVPMSMFNENDHFEDGYTDRPFAFQKAIEKWEAILRVIILGFESYQKMNTEVYFYKQPKKYQELERNYENGFTLFRKYFSNLWD